MIYKLFRNALTGETDVVAKFNSDNSVTSFGFDPANTDYQAYLAWVAAGNTPLPADQPE